MREKILERLQRHLDYLYSLDRYSPDNIIGVFLYGSQNYGFAREDSDVDSVALYVPSFEELCLNKGRLSKEVHTVDNEHIVLKDIREYREMLMKQNVNFLETLFTEYYILNPKYAEYFTIFFLNNKELIATYDKSKMFASIIGQIVHTLNEDMMNTKKLYNSYRLTYLLKDYLSGKPYSECLRPTGDIHAFLWNLKYNTLNYTVDERKTIAADILYIVKELQQEIKGIDFGQAGAALRAMDSGVTAIIRSNIDELANSDDQIPLFFKQITNAERAALVNIIDVLNGNDGFISITKMIEQYNISRPVFTSLLKKMEECHIAEIEKHGVKGTKITFLVSSAKKLL